MTATSKAKGAGGKGPAAKGSGPSRARAVAAAKLAQQKAAERRRKSLIAGGIAIVVLIASAVIGIAVYNSQKPVQVAIPRGAETTGVTLGKAGAKAHLDLYVDYQCPVCKAFEDQSGTQITKWIADGTARVTYHPIAILDGASTTQYSSRASAASGCAADAGKFAEFTTALFAQQPAENSAGISDAGLITIGKSVGAVDTFAQCVTAGKYRGWSTKLTDIASQKGVNSTPTVLVNGKQLAQPTLANLTAAVQKA
jgi:protein-disulfide isomerase